MTHVENSSDFRISNASLLPDLPENAYRLSLTFFVSLGIVVNIFGVTGNVIIIIVYRKMGFSESTNISLVALAIADIGSIMPTQCGCLVKLMSLHSQIPISMEIVDLVAKWPHIVFTRVLTFITCFISLERCLCVVIPLKIKSIITAKRTCLILVLIFIANILPVSYVYFKRALGWKFFPAQNRTLLATLVIKDTPLINIVQKTGLFYYCSFLPTGTCLFVIVCTIFLTVSLRRSKRWRDTITASSASVGNKSKQDGIKPAKTESSSAISKEERTVRIVIAIAVTFVASMLLHIVINLTMHFEEDWNSTGRYKHLFGVLYSVSDLFENINSSINLIIYYKMSSKFRENLLILCNKQNH